MTSPAPDQAASAPADKPAEAPRVMLLSLWAPPGASWHVRLVETDARVHEFTSPFELARFLAHASVLPPRGGAGGLR